MPWRRTRDPYRILLAEYLLQRTRIASGTRYYERFLERFPDVATLAAAPEEDVLRAWEGLGYYRRARHFHAAAKVIVRDHGGRIPSDAAALATLPGIGPYTAGAVASIAFGESVPAVDGNVTRVVSRLFRVEADVTTAAGRARIQELARSLVPAERPGAFNQALMELGSTVCVPRRPACPACPLGDVCLARRAGVAASLPRMPVARRPKTVAVSFAYVRSRGRVLLVRRPESEILGGLWSLPGGEMASDDTVRAYLRSAVAAQAGLRVDVRDDVAQVAHTFSHRRWTGHVYRCVPRGRADLPPSARWATADEVRRMPLVPEHRKLLEELPSRHPLESFDAPRRSRS
jgi:A/G-specific adenine glycosylase